MNRGLGYIPEPLESTSDFEPVLCSGVTPPACDNREYCGEITDQGPTGSCVARAGTVDDVRACHVRCK